MEQRAETKKPSVHVGIRLNDEDQNNVWVVLEASLADNVSDAIRYGLRCAAEFARHAMGRDR